MKYIFTLAFLYVLALQVHAQTQHDIDYYLNHPQISASAKACYRSASWPKNYLQTDSILNSLFTRNKATRPFYLLLVSTMLSKTDGELSEAIGVIFSHFVESEPNVALEFLYTNTALAKPEFKNDWARAIAGEFMIACEGKEKQCIKKWLNKAMKNVNQRNRQNLQALADNVRSFIKP